MSRQARVEYPFSNNLSNGPGITGTVGYWTDNRLPKDSFTLISIDFGVANRVRVHPIVRFLNIML